MVSTEGASRTCRKPTSDHFWVRLLPTRAYAASATTFHDRDTTFDAIVLPIETFADVFECLNTDRWP
jgi:hypothetical protein